METETILVPAQEFPLAFIGLRLREAEILTGTAPSSNLNGEVWTRFLQEEAKKYVPHGIVEDHGVKLGQINPVTFGRLIAKIAHAYAVAEVGFGSFRPLTTNFILGKTDTIGQWVGGEWEIPPATPAAFELKREARTARGKNFLIVNVRLFPFFETPRYHVVVGEIQSIENQIVIDQQSLNGVGAKIALSLRQISPLDIVIAPGTCRSAVQRVEGEGVSFVVCQECRGDDAVERPTRAQISCPNKLR